MDKFKIQKGVLDNYVEQHYPFSCPNCDYSFDKVSPIHEYKQGTYPIGGYRNLMKPKKTLGLGMTCPKCFVKSCCHANKDLIFSIQCTLDIIRMKEGK